MALINDIEEIRELNILPIPAANSTDYLPDFSIAQVNRLIPILGQDLYAELTDAYVNNTLTDIQADLLAACQRVIVPFGYADDIPFRQLMLTDVGIISTDSENSRKPWKWEYANFIEGLFSKGYAAQEALIIFLSANESDFPLWANSPYNDPENCVIIRSGLDLKCLSLEQPNRCYMMLQGIINRLGNDYLANKIGVDFYELINQHVVADELTDEENKLVPMLRTALAHQAMATAINELNVKYGSTGFTIVDQRIQDTIDQGRINATDEQLSRLSQEHIANANKAMSNAINYLNKTASAEVFNEYFESSLYTDPNETNNKCSGNAKRLGTFRMN